MPTSLQGTILSYYKDHTTKGVLVYQILEGQTTVKIYAALYTEADNEGCGAELRIMKSINSPIPINGPTSHTVIFKSDSKFKTTNLDAEVSFDGLASGQVLYISVDYMTNMCRNSRLTLNGEAT
ncbi:hypothetical protein [Variovorax sp. JS1663]|uniref:hypothetical protein n=1 Tax=Variovorax sp. JS1663 TaxID=1851577 RepID=UPI00117F4961|nr:hypothetical protein [Variovorax sp. JS1663]